jgi:hypothetical protein
MVGGPHGSDTVINSGARKHIANSARAEQAAANIAMEKRHVARASAADDADMLRGIGNCPEEDTVRSVIPVHVIGMCDA